MSAELYSQIRRKAVEEERGVTVERGTGRRSKIHIKITEKNEIKQNRMRKGFKNALKGAEDA